MFFLLLFFVPFLIFTRYVEACLNIERLLSIGAIIIDEAQLPKAEVHTHPLSITREHIALCVCYVRERYMDWTVTMLGVSGECVCIVLYVQLVEKWIMELFTYLVQRKQVNYYYCRLN